MPWLKDQVFKASNQGLRLFASTFSCLIRISAAVDSRVASIFACSMETAAAKLSFNLMMTQPGSRSSNTITLCEANHNDLRLLTNDKQAFEQIKNWYIKMTDRKVIYKRSPSRFVQFHCILEGARKQSTFGKADYVPLWHIPITDKLLQMEYKLIAERVSNSFHSLMFAPM